MTITKIMIVEDEKIVAMDIKSSLENLGYAVTAIAASSEVALKKVAETQPDLVLMDIQLKGDIDGIDTAEQIRTNFNIPVIYLTANADNKTLQRATLTEAFGYILKPFEEKELNISIEMAIYKHRQESQVKASERWLATTLNSIGDAVIATNNNNLLVFINTIGEALTGWKQKEVLGKNITEVFNIVNQETSILIASSVTKSPGEGTVIALPEDTKLLTKDGKLIPIAGSATANKNKKGNIIGVILIFRAINQPQGVQEVTHSVSNSGKTKIDDIALVETFVQSIIRGEVILLSNPSLRTEHVGDTIQLLGGKTEGLIVKATLTEKSPSALVKRNSRYWELIHQVMFANSFFPIGQVQGGIQRYQQRPMPENYQMYCTNALDLWKVWVEDKNSHKLSSIPMNVIMLRQGTWKPIVDVIYSDERTLHIKTIGDQVTTDHAEMMIWGKKIE